MGLPERVRKLIEIYDIIIQKQHLSQIFQIKKEWYEALKKLNGYLTPEYANDEKSIIYNHRIWRKKDMALGIDAYKRINFSTPNGKMPFDVFFPNKQAKLGAIAHEAFGHLADDQQYYPNDLKRESAIEENEIFVSNDQRANLRVMHILPNALYETFRQLIISNFRCLGIDPNFGKYEEPLVTMELLGRAGLPRKDDMIGFLKYINDEKELPFDKYLKKFRTFVFAGLAVPPSLNQKTEYGIRTLDGLRDIDREVARYIRGDSKEPPKIITCVDDYDPEGSVDLRGINKNKALLDELDKEISVWKERSARYDGFYCFKDMYENLERMYIRVCSL